MTKTYLEFVECDNEGRKTRIVDVRSLHNYSLGQIRWHSPWRQYVFVPGNDTLYNTGCLEEITAKLQGMNSGHRVDLAWLKYGKTVDK